MVSLFACWTFEQQHPTMQQTLGQSRVGAMQRVSRRSGRGALHVTCVAVPTKSPASRLAKRSKVEIIKEKSDYLRHPLMAELVNENPFISEDAVQLMKFHGSYQQDHREKRAFGQGKFYQFMMRTRQPSGFVTNQLYLVMDELADQVLQRLIQLYAAVYHAAPLMSFPARSTATAHSG